MVATCFTINTDAVGRDNNSQPLKTKTIKQNQDLLWRFGRRFGEK